MIPNNLTSNVKKNVMPVRKSHEMLPIVSHG